MLPLQRLKRRVVCLWRGGLVGHRFPILTELLSSTSWTFALIFVVFLVFFLRFSLAIGFILPQHVSPAVGLFFSAC